MQRLLLDWIDAESGRSAIRRQNHVIVLALANKAKTPLAPMKSAVARAEVALNSPVGQRMPVPGWHGVNVARSCHKSSL
jgi:hypothetical protein